MTNARTEIKAALDRIQCFLLDLDGTIYLGDQLFPFTLPFLEYLNGSKTQYVFVTNNSSRSAKAYLKKLQTLGIALTLDQIYTSGDATIRYLKKQNAGNEIYLLGTPDLEYDFERSGFHTRSNEPAFVVLGFDTTFSYEKFDRACHFIRSGIPFIATHPDLNCPMPNNEMLPDCGALAAAITAATEVKPRFIGKPNREMIDGVAERVKIDFQKIAIIGDRLMTDIQAGIQNNIMSILVLSGETKREDLIDSFIQPDFVVSDLNELLQIIENPE